jgi:predicted phage baseplate assembly protein
VRDVSVARGNIVLADHGLTTEEPIAPGQRTVDGRVALAHAPLTMAARPDPAGEALPAVALRVKTPAGTADWSAVPDLLGSGPADGHFVAEIDDDGRALLRFGDDEYGSALPAGAELTAVYRVGNGRAGNVGADAIAHVAPAVADDAIAFVRNPLAAVAGTDAETIEHVRRLAPQAFHSELFRAVTEEDWARAAERLPGVAGAAATYRWTGSWTTVFVAIDPRDRADVVDLPDGRTRLEAGFERRVRAFLTRFRLAGFDVELRPPRYVGVELAIEVCARAAYFREDVAQAVRDALSVRAFFDPSHFGFGDSVYASRLYAAVAAVPGVESLAIGRLRRFGEADAGELERGELAVGPWEIARLDNDPNFAEHGVLTVTARGGKS